MRMRLTVTAFLVAAAVSLSAQRPDRSKPPVPGPAPTLRVPTIQKQKLSNGLPVWIVEQHEVPVAQVNLVVLSGSGDDPVGKYGIAALTSSMLTEGAGPRAGLDLADAVDFLGADLSAASSSDLSAVRLHAPVARLADALPLLADVAQRPIFAAADLDRLRQQRLTSVRQGRDDANTIAALAFARTLFGTTHRFGTATAGTRPRVRPISLSDAPCVHCAQITTLSAALIRNRGTRCMIPPIIHRVASTP